MISKKKALILSYNRFPKGDAGAIRQETFAKLFYDMGYEVYVIGMGHYTGEQAVSCKQFKYLSFRNRGNDIVSRMRNFGGYAKKLAHFLSQTSHWDLIFVVDLPINAMNIALQYSKKEKSLLLCDRVEWYSSSEFNWKWFSPEYFRNDLKNRFYFNSSWKVIGISSFLSEYFEKKGLRTLRVPVILDVEEYSEKKIFVNEKTVIIYAGAPSRKDCFEQVVKAIEEIKEIDKLELRIVGVSESQFVSAMSIESDRWNKLSKVIRCLGRLPHDQVLKQYQEADYSILLRNATQRYAKAGFPTKVPESLATGTPVICNISSDLDMYLKDGGNAIIVGENSSGKVAEAICRAMNYSKEERENMRVQARQTAVDFFDYRKYVKQMEGFLTDGAKRV